MSNKTVLLILAVIVAAVFLFKTCKGDDIPQPGTSALEYKKEVAEIDQKNNQVNEEILLHFKAIDSLIAVRDQQQRQVTRADKARIQTGLDTLFNFDRYPQ